MSLDGFRPSANSVSFPGDHKVAKTANLWFPNHQARTGGKWWALQDLNLRPTDYEELKEPGGPFLSGRFATALFAAALWGFQAEPIPKRIAAGSSNVSRQVQELQRIFVSEHRTGSENTRRTRSLLTAHRRQVPECRPHRTSPRWVLVSQ